MTEQSILSAVLRLRPELDTKVAAAEGEKACAAAGSAFEGAFKDKTGRWHNADGTFMAKEKAAQMGAEAGAAAGDAYGKELEAGARKGVAATDATVSSGLKKTHSAMTNIMGLGAGFFALEAVKGAFAAQQMGDTIDSVFGKSAEEVKKFSENAANAYGVSTVAAETQLARSGQIMKSILGDSTAEAAKQSTALLGLSADLAAKFGANQEDVMAAFNKAIATGQSRQLKAYGINLTTAAITQEALKEGIVKSQVDMTKANLIWQEHIALSDKLTAARKKFGANSHEVSMIEAQLADNEAKYNAELQGKVPALTAAQKGQAAYALVTRQAGDAQGYFAHHSNNAKEQLAKLHAEFQNFQENIGKTLLPALESIMKPLNSVLNGFNSMPGPMKNLVVWGGMLALVGSQVGKVYTNISQLFSGLKTLFEGVTGKVRGLTAATTENTTAETINAGATGRDAGTRAADAATAEADAAATGSLSGSLAANDGALMANDAELAANTAAREANAAAGGGLGGLGGAGKLGMVGRAAGLAGAAYLGYQGLSGAFSNAGNHKTETLGQAAEIIGGATLAGSVIPGVGTLAGFLFGSAIAGGLYIGGKMSGFASGGTAHPDGTTQHGVWANLAEAGQTEYIVPKNQVSNFVSQATGGTSAPNFNFHVTINGGGQIDERRLAAELEKMAQSQSARYLRTTRVSP